VFGDSSLPKRIHAAFDLLWNGIAPREVERQAAEPKTSPGEI
jgi:hypothetical protein